MVPGQPHHPSIGWRVSATALLLYVGTAGGSLSSTDAVVQFDLTRNIVDNHTVALSDNLLGLESNRGIDGRYYSQYGVGQSIFNIPFYLAGRAAERVAGGRIGKPDMLAKAAVCMSSTVASAAAVTTVFLLAFAVLGDRRAALFTAAMAGAGSLLWPYAKFGFNAPLTAWIVASIALLLWRGVREERRALIVSAGWAAGLGWLTRHEFPIVVLPFVIWLVLETPRRLAVSRLTAFLPGVVAGGALWMTYNVARFGRLVFVGYEPAYTGEGFAGLLLSPSASVFLYWPVLPLCVAGLVALRRRDPSSVRLLAWPVLAVYLYAGLLHDWPGGRSYGPRYLVPMLPLLTIGAGALFARSGQNGRKWLMGGLLLAALAQLPGVLVDYSRVSQAWAQTTAEDRIEQRLTLWEASPLVLNAKEAWSAVPRNFAYLTGRAAIPPVESRVSASDRGFAQQFAFSLDFWWLYLFYLRVLPAAVALLLGALLMGGSMLMGIQTWRLTRISFAEARRPNL